MPENNHVKTINLPTNNQQIIVKQLLEKLIPKYGLHGTARIISKEMMPISYSTIRDMAISLNIKYLNRDEAKKKYSRKKIIELTEKIKRLSKQNE